MANPWHLRVGVPDMKCGPGCKLHRNLVYGGERSGIAKPASEDRQCLSIEVNILWEPRFATTGVGRVEINCLTEIEEA